MTTVTARICLNLLRSRRTRREVLTGFSDPVVLVGDGPEQDALLGDSIGPALLVVLDTLGPAERVAFVLHDVFGVPFAEIAITLDRSVSAAQQLASRARRRLSGSVEPPGDLARQRPIVDAFFAAARDGDFESLLAVLDPDVELRIVRSSAAVVLRGAGAVAGHTATYSALYPSLLPALVDGRAGAVVAPRGRLFSVMAFTIADTRITRIDALLDTENVRLRAATVS